MRIAVVGTGISGLAAAWLLDGHHEVHVFEREPRLGGHTHTIDVPQAGAPPLAVDTGFIVYNEPTYPYLTRLFDELGVATQPSDMSWALSCRRCDLEYAGNARGIVADPKNLLRASYQRLLRDIVRFNRVGRRLVDDPRTRGVTLGRFLTAGGFSRELADHYLLPMAGAIWSSGTGVAADFPLHTLLSFFANHGLLGVSTHHPWRTVAGGTSSYIPRLTAGYADRVHPGDGVVAVTRDGGGVELALASGARQRFDKVVLAAHADEALALLDDPTADEKQLLGAWTYSSNDTWVHTDSALLPRRPAAQASWNFALDDCREVTSRVSLSYHMNRLQSLETPTDYVVTLNPSRPPRPESVVRRLVYTHPAYTPGAVAGQARLDDLNGVRHTFYAGAYHRYGFHEDGLWSAMRVASHFGIRWPR